MERLLRLGILSTLVAALLSGCSGVEQLPHSAANEKARASIEAAGGDPRDWRLDNDCAAAGPCQVELSRVERPGFVVAANRYRVKDSFPTAIGGDAIRRAVERADTR